MPDTDNKLLAAAKALLASGDDTGCDGVIVVGLTEYNTLRTIVAENVDQWIGVVETQSALVKSPFGCTHPDPVVGGHGGVHYCPTCGEVC